MFMVEPPKCPEHGATLCYGVDNGIRIYRCELGFAKIVTHVSEDGHKSFTFEYEAVTHREFWMKDGVIREVTPHISPWSNKFPD